MGSRTKPFKTFERSIPRAEVNYLHELMHRYLKTGETKPLDKWPHPTSNSTQEEIQNAVYKAEGFREWQLFRLALKGFPTKVKLGLLLHRYNFVLVGTVSGSMSMSFGRLEAIRIDNYLMSLRRGGFLDDSFRVVK